MTSPYSCLKHVTAKLWKCKVSRDSLENLEWLSKRFTMAVEKSQTRLVKMDHHEFDPEGITIIAILADSHAVLHTWPEEGFVMVEIFTCGAKAAPRDGIMFLIQEFKPTSHDVVDTFTRI
nr:adenosylmethionine decarboxylase [Candidatus Sigynarchaeota archaeon]